MHRESDNPELETAAVRLYLDESGGQDPKTPHAVVGGIFITRQNFLPFEDAWDQMLEDHGIVPPLHMKEFGRPNGRFANMSDCCRHELFLEAAHLIRAHRIGSLSVSLSNEEYRKHIPKAVRGKFSVYGLCFALSAAGADQLANHNRVPGKIPFILDSGNPYADHIRKTHASIRLWQKSGSFLTLGSLTFADDKDFGILQAADVLAWTARRRATEIDLGYSFGPLASLFEKPHTETKWYPSALKQLGEFLAKQIEIEKAKPEGQRFLPKV